MEQINSKNLRWINLEKLNFINFQPKNTSSISKKLDAPTFLIKI